MKQERNKEIDLLLRRLAGHDGEAAREAQATDDRHLDADELSSYAQNQLPAAARTRYTEHLAECATCRKLVTELSLSLGTVAVAAPVETVSVPSGFKKFLASLFSPLVLRYAVPALGVIVVMIVGFVVLRQQRQHELVATMNDQPKESVAVVATSPSPSRGLVDQQARTPKQAESGESKPSEPKSKSGAGSGEVSGGSLAAAPVAPAKDKAAVAEVQAGVAPTPTPSAGKTVPSESEPPATATDKIATKQPAEAKLNAEAAKQRANVNESARNEVRIAQSAAAEREQDKPKAAPSATGAFSGVGAQARNRPGGARGTADTKRQEEKSAEAQTNEETRTIAGRRFRKERGIWTDTAYDSSTATVNMARESEQFRALVADEPAIGTIAKQLDGELIVVWKGRAYRIR